ncbi:hypothetical protein MRX96_040523 [Rhipicephalus microplus]
MAVVVKHLYVGAKKSAGRRSAGFRVNLFQQQCHVSQKPNGQKRRFNHLTNYPVVYMFYQSISIAKHYTLLQDVCDLLVSLAPRAHSLPQVTENGFKGSTVTGVAGQ